MKKTILNLAIAAIVFAFAGLFSSCAHGEDSDWELRDEVIKSTGWTSMTVDFNYTVPEDLMYYTDITACYNVDNFTDAKWEPMMTNNFFYSYEINKNGVFAPLILVYEASNRLVNDISIDGEITMEITITLFSENHAIDTIRRSYKQSIKSASDINDIIFNVHLRTFGVSIEGNGDIRVIPDTL